jgi:hypothetical protein
LFAEVSSLIIGRLVPCDNFDAYAIYSDSEAAIIETHPDALLEVLLRLLPTDVSRWPHYTGEILDRLARAPTVRDDIRLKQLRRALGRPTITSNL